MPRTPTHTHRFDSSLISRIDWYAPKDATDKPTLAVYLQAGAVYTYLDVPLTAYQAFAKAESAGRHFGQHIKGKYAVLR